MKTGVVIPAAGQGRRMQAGKNKLFLTIGKTPVLIHTVRVFATHPDIDRIVVVVNENELSHVKKLLRRYGLDTVVCVPGGEERQESVYCGVQALQDVDHVLVHDGARPFVRRREIDALLRTLQEEQAALLAVPVKDTIKVVEQSGRVRETPPRESLWAAQTPQAFRMSVLKDAFEKAMADGFRGTDDASLVERLGIKVTIVQGSYENLKLTTPDDLIIANMMMERRRETED